jgi:tRNA (guanine-N7-)-methyltransferase
MSVAQKRSYDALSPQFCIPFAPDLAALSIPLAPDQAYLNYHHCFGNENPLTVEIGFGMGIATALIAETNPQKNYLGLEVHRPGIGRLLWEIEKRNLKNIRIIEHDAVEVLEKMISPNSVAAFHIFFPDPWPKKRHHKRRLITRPFTDLLAEKLTGGAYIYMVTDWEDYGNWALAEFSATPGLVNPYGTSGKISPGIPSEVSCGIPNEVIRGFAPPQLWRPRTKFEQKGIDKNHEVREIYFVKKE